DRRRRHRERELLVLRERTRLRLGECLNHRAGRPRPTARERVVLGPAAAGHEEPGEQDHGDEAELEGRVESVADHRVTFPFDDRTWWISQRTKSGQKPPTTTPSRNPIIHFHHSGLGVCHTWQPGHSLGVVTTR